MASLGHESESQPLLEAQLRATLDVIPAYTWYADPSGALTFVNKRHADYLGLPKDHPLRFGIATGAAWDSHIPLLHPDDHEEARRVWSTSLRTGSAGEMPFRVRNAAGEYRWFLTRAEPLRARDGTLLYWIGVNLEIDDAKRAEDALRKSEKGLRDVIDTIPALVWSALPDGSNTYVNKRFVEYTGSSAEQTAGSGWQALVHPDDLERHTAKWMEAIATGKPHESEVRSRRSDGQYRWQLDRGLPLRDKDGNIVKWYGVTTDIEDRKRAEQALQQSQFYLAEGQRLAHTGSWVFGPAAFDYWSPELFRIYGLDPATNAPTVQEYLDRIHPQDREFMANLIKRILADASCFDVTKRIVRPDGKVRYIRCVGAPVVENQRVKNFVGTAIDVTEHELLTQELRRREAYLAEAQRLSHTGSFGWRPDSGEIVWSDETYRIFAYDRGVKPTIDLLAQRIHPEDRPDFLKVIERASAGSTQFEHAYRLLLPDRSVKHVHALAHALLDASGNREFVGAVTDVTTIKRAEEELRKSEAYLAEGQRLSRTGSWAWNPEQDTGYWSEECARVLGFDPQYGLPRLEDFFQRLHPDDQPGFREVLETAIRKKAEWETDFRIVHPDSSVRDIHIVGHPVLSASGHLVEFVGTVIDVTERKRAEEELRRSEAELRQIVDLTPQLVGVFGPNRERLYANRVLIDYLGVSLEEWRKRSDRGEFFHPDDRERVHDHFDRAHSTSSAFEVEMRLRKGDGSYRWFLARYNPLRDDKRQITRWYAASTDIEDRKRAEEKLQQENAALREEIDQTSMFEEIVGTSPALQTVLSRISKVAPSDSSVLVTGETGTGKELVARAIHRRSKRSGRAFVSVNCAAIPRDLILSELFGHEKGAFTGAMQRRLGRFEMADGGTIFLDEVGELSPDTQVALLRVLQEREFERVGGGQPIHVDVRLIAATNRDLQAAVGNGTFRQDLFYRLNVFPIEVPPLRKRKDDIRMLVEYFVQRYAAKAGKHFRSIDKKTLGLLQSYEWPGNIRELQNVIERSVIVSETETFSIDESWLSPQAAPSCSKPHLDLAEKLAAQEKELIEAALRESGGRVYGPSGAAAKLGMPRSTLETKIRSLKVNKHRFKS